MIICWQTGGDADDNSYKDHKVYFLSLPLAFNRYLRRGTNNKFIMDIVVPLSLDPFKRLRKYKEAEIESQRGFIVWDSEIDRRHIVFIPLQNFLRNFGECAPSSLGA